MSSSPRRAPLRRAERVAAASLLVTVALALLKFAVWGATSSLSVLSQALDSVLDVVALALVLVAVRLAGKPADESHHYGHAKAENLAAFAQTLLIGVVVAGIAYEAIGRLGRGVEDVSAPWYAIALLVVSLVVDVVRVRVLTRTGRSEGSEALRAGALNIAGDLGTAGVALVSLLSVRGGIEGADAVGALVVAGLVGVTAVRLGARSVDVLMDRAPRTPTEAIERAAASAPGVTETRRVRVRSGGDKLFADVTVAAGRTTSLERAHDIAESVETAIEAVAPGTDVVVHVEPVAETGGLVERVQAAASRSPDVHEVHNILVHAFNDAGERKLHVTLHAKVPAGLSVAAAHDLSEQVEQRIIDELGDNVRVDSHLEPLTPTTFAEDVTESRADLVDAVTRAALREEDILDCHEVIVTAGGGELAIVAHVRGRGSLPLTRIHDASTRIETAVRATFPDVGSVLLHFEPS